MAMGHQLGHDTIDTKTLYCYFTAKIGECTRGDRCKYSHRWSEGMRVAEAPMKNRDAVSVAGMNRRILEQSRRVPSPTTRGAPTRNLKADWRPLSAPVPAPVLVPVLAPTPASAPAPAALAHTPVLLFGEGPEWHFTRRPGPPDWRLHGPANRASLYAALLVGSSILPWGIPAPPISCGVIGDGRSSSMPL